MLYMSTHAFDTLSAMFEVAGAPLVAEGSEGPPHSRRAEYAAAVIHNHLRAAYTILMPHHLERDIRKLGHFVLGIMQLPSSPLMGQLQIVQGTHTQPSLSMVSQQAHKPGLL